MAYQEADNRCRTRWSEYPRPARIALMVLAGLVFVPVLLVLFGMGTMWLWNWLMPVIFKLPTITFWQAIGLLLLSQILFKGGHMRKSGRSHWKKEKIRHRMGQDGPDAPAPREA